MSDVVSLQVGGDRFEGWTSVSVSRGIERAAASFNLEVSERWPGRDTVRRIRPGEPIELRIGDDLVITGFVDEVSASIDESSHKVQIQGRSRTADMIDCAAPEQPGQHIGRRLDQIAAALAAPYGIAVRAQVANLAIIADFQVQQGETAFQAVERLSRIAALLTTDDETGALVLTRAGTTRAADALELGRNLLSASVTVSMAERFSEVVVKGQRPGEELGKPGEHARVKGVARDREVPRFRRHVLIAEGPVDNGSAGFRAEWEVARRAGRGLRVEATVQGWRQADGRLWRANELVHVLDPILGIDRELLVAEVDYRLSEAGTLTRLDLAPREAFDLLPEAQKGQGITLADLIEDDLAQQERQP